MVHGIADMHQPVGAQYYEFTVRQEDFRWLVVGHSVEEGVDGVRQMQRMSGALGSVKVQYLREKIRNYQRAPTKDKVTN